MEKITHIICFAVKLIMALLIVGGMVFIITVNSVCRTAFATFTSALAYGLLMCSFFFFYFKNFIAQKAAINITNPYPTSATIIPKNIK